MTDIIAYAQFVASKVGKTGLTPTVDVHRITRSDGTISQIVTGQNATAVGRGVYLYRVTGADLVLYDYAFIFITADATVDQQEIPALWTSYSVAYATELAYLDAAITSRLAPTVAGRTLDVSAGGSSGVDWGNVESQATVVDLENTTIDTSGLIAFPSGAITFTYTVTDSVSLLPVEGVDIWFATDNAFANIIWRGVTDVFGVARDVNNDLPKLDAGTYYIRLQKTGYTFADDTEVVS